MLFDNKKCCLETTSFVGKGVVIGRGEKTGEEEAGTSRVEPGLPCWRAVIELPFFSVAQMEIVVRNWRVIQGENTARVEIDETDEPEFGDGDEEWGEEEGVNVHVWVPTPHFVISIMAICLTGLIGYAMYLIGGK